jgi:hypothetical protein
MVVRDGHQPFAFVQADQFQPGFDRGFGTPFTPSLVDPDDFIVAILLTGGTDIQGIAELGTFEIPDVYLVDSKTNAFLMPQPGQFLCSDHMLTGPFEILKIIGMIHYTGMVRVLVINLNFEMMHLLTHGFSFPLVEKIVKKCL